MNGPLPTEAISCGRASKDWLVEWTSRASATLSTSGTAIFSEFPNAAGGCMTTGSTSLGPITNGTSSIWLRLESGGESTSSGANSNSGVAGVISSGAASNSTLGMSTCSSSTFRETRTGSGNSFKEAAARGTDDTISLFAVGPDETNSGGSP